MTPDIGLANWLAQRALRTPERHALAWEDRRWTYAQLQARVEATAARLAGGGVRPGDRVAFLGLNQPAFIFALFATARLGAIFVPLNFRLTGPELAVIVGDAEAHTVIADAPHQAVLDGVRAQLPSVRQWLGVAAAGQAPGASPGWAPLDDGAAATVPAHRGAPDDVAVIMYTSGTTGRPKGAMLTHANFWWNNANAMHALDILGDDITLCAAPLFHIGGLNVLTLLTLQKGGEAVLQRAFEPGAALAAIARHRVSTMFGVPAMFQFMAQHPDFATTDLSSLRLMICGGAPCPESLLRTYLARGVPIQQGYGLTETAPMVSFLTPEYALEKIGSSGRPPLFTEVKLVDTQGDEVRVPGERGEVLTRGPTT